MKLYKKDKILNKSIKKQVPRGKSKMLKRFARNMLRRELYYKNLEKIKGSATKPQDKGSKTYEKA